MGIAGLEMFNYFLYDRKALPYCQLPYATFTERVIEVPITLQFLREAGAGKEAPFLEIGDTLAHYEELFKFNPELGNRHSLDKPEQASHSYRHIVALSTLASIGQQGYGEESTGDREAPLKAIVHIYNLLEPNGTALLTVPYGKLMDIGWLIQFSAAYLSLIHETYGIPLQAISLSYFRKLDMDTHAVKPKQAWIQCQQEELSEALFDSPFKFANGIVVIRLRKIGGAIALLPATASSLTYDPPVTIGNLYYTPFIRPVRNDKDGLLEAMLPGYLFYGPSITLAPKPYRLQASIELIGQGEFTLDLTSNSCKKVLWSQILSQSEAVDIVLNLSSEERDVEIRLYKHNSSHCFIRVPQLLLTELN